MRENGKKKQNEWRSGGGKGRKDKNVKCEDRKEKDATELQAATVSKRRLCVEKGDASRRRCASEATAMKEVVREK